MSFDKLIKCIRIGQIGSGFTNQIFALVNGLLLAHHHGQQLVIVESFHDNYDSVDAQTPFAKLVDVTKLNEMLRSCQIKLTVVDRHEVKFEVDHCMHGDKDITKVVRERFCHKPNSLQINHGFFKDGVVPNKEDGDWPLVTIDFQVNGTCLHSTHTAANYLTQDLVFDLTKADFVQTFGWMTTINHRLFDMVLTGIPYTKTFVQFGEQFLTPYRERGHKVNVFHIRLEDDALRHWANCTQMDILAYRKQLVNKYITLIKQHVTDKEKEQNIVLSYEIKNNEVVAFLQADGYTCHYVEKKLDWGREKNALVDFLVAIGCNNVFIGNFDMGLLRGSTFSYYIFKKLECLKSVKKQILVDLYDLNKPVQVF